MAITTSSSSSSTSHREEEEVHLAIYDLSMGMARGLSAQFLGPDHAVDIIPHTAILAFGKEYFFGQGIEWCAPHEFRRSRGIQPIEIRPLGRTRRTSREFEDWCRDRGSGSGTGDFGPTSYDFFHRNCNNFSDEAARSGLMLERGVPPWILDLPRKFLSSPMGAIVRPILEQMQITNGAPTNLPPGGGGGGGSGGGSASPFQQTPSPFSAAAGNPWATIPAAKEPTPPAERVPTSRATPLLDKQKALLSTDTGVVKLCIDRLEPEQEQKDLLSKLADVNAPWSSPQLDEVHQFLRSVDETKHASFALMLLRLAVLRRPSGSENGTTSGEEQTQSANYVGNALLEGKLKTLATRSMAWCVLSNALGSTQPPEWKDDALARVIDLALRDADPTSDEASSKSHVSLRQSAAAFLYNATIICISSEKYGASDGTDGAELSEGGTSILLGCLEHVRSESNDTALERHCMAVGQLLKSSDAAVALVKDLGLVEPADFCAGKGEGVVGLAREVVSLLQ